MSGAGGLQHHEFWGALATMHRRSYGKGVAVLSRSASPGELASERTSTEASQESHPDSGL